MGKRNKTQDKATLREYTLYTDQGHIHVDTPEWFAWLENNKAFYISVIHQLKCEVSVRVEVRHGTRHWYAYKRVHGTLYKRYVGQRPKFKDIKAMLRKMVGTDFFMPVAPMPRFADWK